MYKTILITLLLLLCLGVVAKAEPLPLVPGTATEKTVETTVAKTVQTAAKSSEKITEKTDKEKETSASTTDKQTEEPSENIILDTEEQAAAAAQSGNSDTVKAVEGRHGDWFKAEQKTVSEADRLAAALVGAGDYRSKTQLGTEMVRGIQEIKETGQAAAEDIRAAMDALFGWDFNYGLSR